MRIGAFVLGFVVFGIAGRVGASPAATDVPVEISEKSRFLGFSSGGEGFAAFEIEVTQYKGALERRYQVIRIVSSQTEDVVSVFRAGRPSPAPEWQKARSGWETYRARQGFSFKKLDLSKSAFRLAIDQGDHVRSEATKQHIVVNGVEGSGIGMTPVVRLYDGRREYLGAMRVEGVPGRSLSAEVEVFHSSTGMHIAVLVHYRSSTATMDAATDIGRVFTMPGDPLGTTEIGALNMTAASEVIGERRFSELDPGFEEPFIKWGRDTDGGHYP